MQCSMHNRAPKDDVQAAIIAILIIFPRIAMCGLTSNANSETASKHAIKRTSVGAKLQTNASFRANQPAN